MSKEIFQVTINGFLRPATVYLMEIALNVVSAKKEMPAEEFAAFMREMQFSPGVVDGCCRVIGKYDTWQKQQKINDFEILRLFAGQEDEV